MYAEAYIAMLAPDFSGNTCDIWPVTFRKGATKHETAPARGGFICRLL